MEKREPRRRVEGYAASRRVSRGVGSKDCRKLDERCCWPLLLDVVVGDAGCLGVLPLRLMGAEEKEAIGRSLFCICGLGMFRVKARKICRCHCEI